jgi:hypothetical protein
MKWSETYGRHPLSFSRHGTSFIFHLIDRHIMKTRRRPGHTAPASASPRCGLLSRGEFVKAKQITPRHPNRISWRPGWFHPKALEIHDAAVRLIWSDDTFTKKKQYPSASVFHPPQCAGFYTPPGLAGPRFSTFCQTRKTPPRRGMAGICLSNTMDCRCTIL